jgi:hypothetical protein
VAQDLSVSGLTPLGADWKLLLAFETARGTNIDHKRRRHDREPPDGRRGRGVLARPRFFSPGSARRRQLAEPQVPYRIQKFFELYSKS